MKLNDIPQLLHKGSGPWEHHAIEPGDATHYDLFACRVEPAPGQPFLDMGRFGSIRGPGWLVAVPADGTIKAMLLPVGYVDGVEVAEGLLGANVCTRYQVGRMLETCCGIIMNDLADLASHLKKNGYGGYIDPKHFGAS